MNERIDKLFKMLEERRENRKSSQDRRGEEAGGNVAASRRVPTCTEPKGACVLGFCAVRYRRLCFRYPSLGVRRARRSAASYGPCPASAGATGQAVRRAGCGGGRVARWRGGA